MKTILTALTFASSLLSAPVFAQDATMTMEQGLSMLEQMAANELNSNGITGVDVMGLTLNQLAMIHGVATKSDTSETDKAQELKTIVGAN